MSALLAIDGLRVRFETDDGTVPVLDGFDLAVGEGASLGIVGESGSGKSTAFLAPLGLLPPSARVEARALRYRDLDLLGCGEKALRSVRGRHVAMVFQDAAASLNPYLRLGRQIGEVAETHAGASPAAARSAALDALAAVALQDPAVVLAKYPHELSGGQRQRAAIAMAIVGNPSLLVADEPTTALDPTVQSQVLALLARLRRERALALAVVSHDLGVVAGIADRVAVVYAGRVVEEAASEDLFASPRHPYTAALLASVPSLVGARPRRLAAIEGAPPGPFEPREACAFAPRCARATPRCRRERPVESQENGLRGPRRFVCFEPVGDP